MTRVLATNRNSTRTDWLHPPPEEEGLRRYVETIRERIGLVLLCAAVTTAVAILYVLIAPKTYEATADLLVTPVSSDDPTLTSLPLIRESSDPTRDVETGSLLVANTDVAERVKNEINSDKSVRELLGDVSAEPVAQSNFVAVTATADTPEGAQALANGFAREAVDDRTEVLHAEIATKLEEVGSELPPAELAQLQTLSTGPSPDMRFETEADLPTSQASPQTMLSIAAGVIGGLVLGIAAAFAAQILDPRLRREAQLRRLYALPILARVPREGGRRQTPLTPRTLSSAGSESYRALRTTLTALSQDDPHGRTILVTGPSAGEGKSTTAINLASSLAQTGKKVILIEADLRRPSVGPALGVAAELGGVVGVLVENIRLSDALVPSPTHGDNLQLLLADHHEGGWIAELFSIPAAQKMLDDARQLADFVIVDSPPLNEVVDSFPLALKADEVLLVVRIGRSRLDKIAQLAELLAENGIRPVGFAVVGTPRPSKRQYQYYGARGANEGRERKLVPKPKPRPRAGQRPRA